MILYALFGIAFGVVGGMGLGGGIVLIPALTLIMQAGQHEAQGITLFAYIPMALAALIMHIRNKQIKLKEIVGIAIFGVAGSVLGYFLATILDADLLRIFFAVFLILIAVLRIYKQEIKPKKGNK